MTDGALAHTSSCRSCGAPLAWARTTAGKAMPLDPDPVEGGNVELTSRGIAVVHGQPELAPDGPRYVAHFATCKHADQHRQR